MRIEPYPISGIYERQYKGSWKHDSPERTRVELAGEITTLVRNNALTNNWVLNVGSGPQSLEKQLAARLRQAKLDIPNIVTMDLASIEFNKLLAQKYPSVKHIQANAATLPFANDTFGLTMSNLAVDFAPHIAIDELYRVTAQNGLLRVNLHHRNMLPEDLSTIENRQLREFWMFLRETNHLFCDQNAIEQRFSGLGFVDVSVIERSYPENGVQWWWEVRAVKPAA